MLVHHFLRHSTNLHPHKTCLVCGRRRFSYREVDSQSDRLARGLVAHGLEKGDRVVLHLSNSAAAAIAIFAVLKAGGVFVCINRSTKPEKLARILHHCRATALLAELPAEEDGVAATDALDSPYLRLVVDCANELRPRSQRSGPAVVAGAEWIQRNYPAEPADQRAADDDLACLIYTSGSSGEPKAVMSEHRQVVFASGSIIQYLRNVEDDVILNVLPLSFDYGLYQWLMTVRFGGTLILEPSFTYPGQVLKRLGEERVTGFPGVPTMFALLLQMNLAEFDFSRLRYITNTAAALPPAHVLELRRKFPNAAI